MVIEGIRNGKNKITMSLWARCRTGQELVKETEGTAKREEWTTKVWGFMEA